MNAGNMINLLLTINVRAILEGCFDGDRDCLDAFGQVMEDFEARFPVGQC